ncbi:hypothetical protein ABZT03_35870 [Streptomyces sp. NPDC005574]|uniref:hypothetical protein n=1 Tax=Streptomyces sp. NPDC005574 TaxID=3156891 RepID=UPI0033A550BA
MADERCVFPGDAPRTPGRWLDRETAERLLSGEALDNAVDGTVRDEAELLAKTLGSLSVENRLAGAELPGEAAAVAAFRKAREARQAVTDGDGREGRPPRGDREADGPARGHRGRSHDFDAGLVRIGAPDRPARRPRRVRPAHLGLAAALAVGMVGGVAVAAGTGILPTPFGPARPAPAVSASAEVTPDLQPPPASPEVSGDAPTSGGSGPSASAEPPGSPGTAGSSGSPGRDSRHDTAGAGSARGGSGRDRDDRWTGAAPACRDVRAGRELTPQRRRALEDAAGGSARVWTYCKGVLSAAPVDGSADQSGQSGQDDSNGGGDGKGDGTDQGNEDGDGHGGHGGDDGGHHLSPGHGSGHGHGHGRSGVSEGDSEGDGTRTGDSTQTGDAADVTADVTPAAPLLPRSTTSRSPSSAGSPTPPYRAL